VALVSEAGADLVDALFRAAGDVGIHNVRNKCYSHCRWYRSRSVTTFRCDISQISLMIL
jgi:hypothetical protein